MDEPQRSFATDPELHSYKGAEGKSGQFTQLSGQLTYLSMQGRSILSRKDPAFAITHPLNPMPALLLGGTRQRHHLKLSALTWQVRALTVAPSKQGTDGS